MFAKIIRWVLIGFAVLATLIGVAIFALSVYLESRQEKLLNDLQGLTGLDIAFRRAEYTAWTSFPRLSLSLDSVVIRDNTRPPTEPALLDLDQLTGNLRTSGLFFDTLYLEDFVLKGGSVYLHTDSTGQLNLGKLTGPKDTTGQQSSGGGLFSPEVAWSGLNVNVSDLDFVFRKPYRKKNFSLYVDSLRTIAVQTEENRLNLVTDLETYIYGLGFNTDKGLFLQDSRLSSRFDITRLDDRWELSPTDVEINKELYTVSAFLLRGDKKGLELDIAKKDVNYDTTLALLPQKLQEKLSRFHVTGTAPARATIFTTLQGGEEPVFDLAFSLDGQDVRIKKYRFTDVHGAGTIINRLPEVEGGIKDSKKNLRLTVSNGQGYQDGIFIETPGAVIRSTVKDTWLEGPIKASGTARTLGQRLQNDNFLFRKGTFNLDAFMNATLNDQEEMFAGTDGKLVMKNVAVDYEPAGVTFPFRRIQVNKNDKDIRFDVASAPLRTGFTFDLTGKIDNLLPLLLERPADSMRTDVTFRSPRIDWYDFLAIFGEEGYMAENEQSTGGGDKQSMKKTLLGLRSTFRPNLEASFDTVAYYDVMELHNFTTGLRFDGDTLVLERTSFEWEGSDVAFGANLGLGQPNTTPFRVNLNADGLNLKRLRPSLEYFGLALPDGLNSLPEDLNVSFSHRGQINDALGIEPGHNAGRLAFNDGRADLFTGRVRYAPVNGELNTQLRLDGDPRIVNKLFAAEDFFFGSGRFSIDLDLVGTPADLGELVENAHLKLRIDSSRISYRGRGVAIPVRHFSVDAQNDHVDYDMRLVSDATRRAVTVKGTMDRLTAFLYPELDRTFRLKSDLRAENLRWSDLRDFVVPDTTAENKPQASTGATAATDTTTFNSKAIFSASEGIFSSFRPDMSILVDTFWADDVHRIYNVHAGLRLRDSTGVILEKSGFRLGGGSLEVSAAYDLDRRRRSPFDVDIDFDSLSLEEVRATLSSLQIPALDSLGQMAGKLKLKGDFTGHLDEKRQQLLMDSLSGQLAFSLTKTEMLNWPELLAIGRRAWMEHRFFAVQLNDLSGEVTVRDGQLVLPQTEIQSTPLQIFVEGQYDTLNGPDFLISIPLRNIGRGVLDVAPPKTGYALAGWKVHLVMMKNEDGVVKPHFRLGRRKYYKERGRLAELKAKKAEEKAERKAHRRAKKKR